MGGERIIKQKGTQVMIRYSLHIFQGSGEAATLPLTKSIPLGEHYLYHAVGQGVCMREIRVKTESECWTFWPSGASSAPVNVEPMPMLTC